MGLDTEITAAVKHFIEIRNTEKINVDDIADDILANDLEVRGEIKEINYSRI